MTTEKIFIGIDDQVIEAKGEVLRNLLAEIEAMKEEEAAAAAKVEAKNSAMAKLAALGLDEAEINAVLS
jgi:hypothetical protein